MGPFCGRCTRPASCSFLYKGWEAGGPTHSAEARMTTQLNPGLAVLLCVVVAVPLANTAAYVPQIPESQKDSPLADLWRHAIKQQGPATECVEVPKTFISPSLGEVINWVPQDTAHPLYASEYFDLLREILLDYMVDEVVKPDDPRMSQPSGLQVKNRNGKTIIFKLVSREITTNGVKVGINSVNNDGSYSYILYRSLFRHREKVKKAWEEYNTKNPINPVGKPKGRRFPTKE
ncbi:uncharacterized protein LOC123509903 [Portunus trituberculatus]|uniref:uncharacterized protein LOC123509903 n=1 Tax=Portunus trituberculatus TaxID=210409 RepID=UPI001E1CDDB2|nr:uncharacterized protein LOC123509903 [Portunus trituberculatus]